MSLVVVTLDRAEKIVKLFDDKNCHTGLMTELHAVSEELGISFDEAYAFAVSIICAARGTDKLPS